MAEGRSSYLHTEIPAQVPPAGLVNHLLRYNMKCQMSAIKMAHRVTVTLT